MTGQDPWWMDDDTHIGTSYTRDDGIGEMHARQLPGGDWEYTEIHWRHHSPHEGNTLRGGRMYGPDGNEVKS